MADATIDVVCEASDDGWRCQVTVGDDPGATQHEVTVDADTLLRLGGGGDPSDLVRESFHFLLEREPRTSILDSFELPIIGRYFSEYEDEIQRRMRRTG
jgi:hypothetical protein